jgi:Leucine-rich repeat (LRR) protein
MFLSSLDVHCGRWNFLPDIFNSLVNLQDLNLSFNKLTGELPMSFSGSGIQNLWLNHQNPNNMFGFTGSISVLASMIHLTQVWLMKNSFTGQIPDFTNCTNLFDLQLRDNQLTGVVPPSLMVMSSLQNVTLDNNYLQGPFPSFGKGVSFDLDGTSNSFCQNTSGPCDPQVTTLLHVAEDFGYPLQLANSWKGNDPCQDWSFIVCSAGNIITVNLAKQKLEGTISPAFGNLTDLRNLHLSGNNLTGSIPGSLTGLVELEVLDVSNNNLSGEIPKFPTMVDLHLSGNVLLQLGNLSKNTTASAPLLKNTTASASLLPWILGEPGDFLCL